MLNRFFQNIKRQEWYKQQIEHIEEIPAREPRYGKLDKPLPNILQNYLDREGIKLYSHQADAINSIRRGKNVIITTPTASGKTIAFNIPVFEALLKDKDATALYIYPTKALTNDQLHVLRTMERRMGIRPISNVYDGDTPQRARQRIRRTSRIILSNPYGLHQYLPWHHKWKSFFQHLKFIIIDEAHMYRGVFGSNVAMLVRRILRICEYYGSNPQFILSSATIANPEEHSRKLTGRDFEVISNDGSIRERKFFVFWNPPFIDSVKMVRRSPHQETKNLFVFHIKNGLQTICFTVSRQMAELITRWSRDELGNVRDRITTYRAGYLPEERREIERRLRTRELLGVASTNALELGIDIGSLDAVIISGYPGTIISTWQQAGRAGRGYKDSLVTLIAFENPLDQYFMKHPDEFFGRAHEYAIIDLENPYIVMGHLMCASAELPVKEEDGKYFNLFEESLMALERQNMVRKTPNGWIYSGTARPVDVVNLNNISDKIVTIISDGKVLETMDLPKAYAEAHRGAVLLHQGETYLVEDLDLENLTARAVRRDISYYTEPRKTVNIRIINTEAHQKKRMGIDIEVGEVEVTEWYHSYVLRTYDRVIGKQPLDLPPLNFQTVGVWFTIPGDIEEKVRERGLDLEGGIHAIEHAMIAMTPLYAMCDRWDVGGISSPMHVDTQKPTIFIYDSYEGGIGISERIYDLFESLLRITLRLIQDCGCDEGCPSCIYSPKCGNENRPLSKEAAIFILREIIDKIKETNRTTYSGSI
ncbi:MAG TPA: DEAD/DEAH box helicase [Candidatus Altiarchaeales archaeon]|nr:DEAD/DEAH box helicase [Candidatus Altiarchaeales archaeon]